MQSKVTVPEVLKRKSAGEPLVAITAYDFPFARLVDEAGIDIILVGDSLGMVVQGLDTTLPVTLEEILYHCRMVVRARRRALVVADLPFGSYQTSVERALESAARALKEGGAEAVKLEGGVAVAPTIRAMTAVDIPVMGHIGLTPQSVHRMGGHKVQGQRRGHGPGQQERLIEDALAVEEAGAFAIVLEGIPRELAAEITRQVSIPTIGIGAGPDCDGQILVLHDVLGLTAGRTPKFAKRYTELAEHALFALRTYAQDVRNRQFPGDEHAFHTLLPVGRDKAVGAE